MNNPWTPERVKKLTELWLAGWTRAEVAEALGPPVTESAVKGKVRRLGLKRDSGAAGKQQSAARTPQRASTARSAQSASGSHSTGQGSAAPSAGAGPNRADDASHDLSQDSIQASADSADELAWTPEDVPAGKAAGDASGKGESLSGDQPSFAGDRRAELAGDTVVPGARAADSAADLGGEREFRFPGYNECHWPHGEPDNPDFYFCLAPVAPGKSYCEAHAEQAYRKKGS